ncbi:mitochondrial 2-oxoglutarate/malate carrier protein-like isoform X2 [Phymastichus coffea]|uniref:mitochondrial 2-oxoglutarate/malate carrier protein-like isoform X2 n=1 Tax=Phymastichus coffea TaxID=108790 RepID=UPI00273C10E4|nr:mitochondrial 2-oxoglutarate/malate carrier protein-like isoform X2 [Phymastichus coffea]
MMAASCLVYPLDLIKIRMQLNESETASNADVSSILKNEGVTALYSGLSASLLRHAAHTTTRLAIYTWLFDLASSDSYPDLWLQIGLGTLAGCVSSFVWTPAELAFIRLAANSRLPVDQRRNYKNVFDTVMRVAREEGFFTLWRGAVLTANCTMIVSGLQIETFIHTLIILARSEYFDSTLSIWLSSFAISGLVTAAIVTPIDVVKTRVQNMTATRGRWTHSDTIDVLIQIIRYEGVYALWKGFLPHFARLALHTVFTSIFIEKMTFQQLPDFPFFNAFS